MNITKSDGPSPAALEIAVRTVFEGEISRPASCVLYRALQTDRDQPTPAVRPQYRHLDRFLILQEVSRIAFTADKVLRPFRAITSGLAAPRVAEAA